MVRRYNETTKKWQIKLVDLEYGIVYVNDNYIEFGYFDRKCADKIVLIDQNNYCCMKGISADWLIYSNYDGFYIPKRYISEDRIKFVRHKKGQGNFPYSFERKYEAIENFDIFKNKHVVDSNIQFRLSKYMPYTFGLEFETSMGYIPQEKCFEDGLIPLRDGSISGLEYSTIILKGNEGLNLLCQQVKDLDKYTAFNKECSLHMHFGGYPITAHHIYLLYQACCRFQGAVQDYIPRYSFYTDKYKNNGKSYCKLLPSFNSFAAFFCYMTNQPFFDDFTQPHPSDLRKEAKWRISQRYYCVNFINALCYLAPKTIEFRFLRPTFNFRVIYLWLAVFNALLSVCEKIINKRNITCVSTIEKGFKDTDYMPFCNLSMLIDEAYEDKDPEFAEYLHNELDNLLIATRNQTANEDYCGRDISFIEEMFTPQLAAVL